MKPVVPLADSQHIDMSPEAIDQRLRDLAQIYKLGMSVSGAQWLGPVSNHGTSSLPTLPGTACNKVAVVDDSPPSGEMEPAAS